MSVTAVAAALMLGSALPQVQVAEAQTPETQVVVSSATARDEGASDSSVEPASPQATSAEPTDQAPASDQPDPAEPVPAQPVAEAQGDAPLDVAADDGDIIIVTHHNAPPGDPLEHINVQSFHAVQAVDTAVVEPVAKVYNKGLPRPVRQGLRNFFVNLGEPVVAVAYLLEFKPGKAVETAGRFAINTTIGIGGLIDVAKRKPFYLPYRPNGLSNVLGYYGVGPGPFMYLPIIGPTTLRDIIGDTVDNLASPSLLGKPFTKPAVLIGMTVVDQLGERAAFDKEINTIRQQDDPYATYRELYLKQRKAEIEALHGRTMPDVVPVYGPGMRTAGGKKAKPDEASEAPSEPAATPAVTPDVTAQPEVSAQGETQTP